MELYSFSKAIAYKGIWKQLIARSFDRGWPVCLGISWRNMDRSGKGNHAIYVTGYEGNTVHARDQQNGHVLISVVMEDPGSATNLSRIEDKPRGHRLAGPSWLSQQKRRRLAALIFRWKRPRRQSGRRSLSVQLASQGWGR